MKKKILSIVVPSYNTAEFMEKNIRTMLHDELIGSIEILIVNDGSKDDTLLVANKLMTMYPDSIRVINKPNGGHGSVINRGIKEATGTYFRVIDGDDYVDSNEFCDFISTLKKVDVDCIIGNYNTVSAITGERVFRVPVLNKSEIEYNKSYPIEQILPCISPTIHAITYKTELLKNNFENVKVLEGVFYEDMEFVSYPMIYAKNIFISDTIVYQYLIDQANQSVSLSNHRNRLGDSIKGVNTMICHYNEWEKSIPDYKLEYIMRRIQERIKGIYRLKLSFPKNTVKHKRELMKFEQEIKESSNDVYMYSGKDPVIKILRTTKYIAYWPLNLLLRKE